jgi:hypothetical protein
VKTRSITNFKEPFQERSESDLHKIKSTVRNVRLKVQLSKME